MLLLQLLNTRTYDSTRAVGWLLLLRPLGESCTNDEKINNKRGHTKQDARTHEEQQSNERQRLTDDENHHVYAGQSVITQPQKKEMRREGWHAPHNACSLHSRACCPYIDGTISIVLVST